MWEFEGQLEEGLSGPSGDIDIWGSLVVEERISEKLEREQGGSLEGIVLGASNLTGEGN